jgi:hypothetical protein
MGRAHAAGDKGTPVKKTITLNTEPHEAVIGPHTLLFQPEMYGDEFLDAYGRLQEVQKTLNDGGQEITELSGDRVRALYGEMKTFLARLMTPECGAEFSRFEVVTDQGQPTEVTVSVHLARDDAEEAAAALKNATVVDKGVRLPDRVLVELMEWVVELYAGGTRPTGSSNGSARASSKAGTAGKGPSPSRASIRAAGR